MSNPLPPPVFRLGAQSLRQLLLLRDKMTDSFPCPPSAALRQSLKAQGHESNLVLDLLEVADLLGAKAAHFLCDRRAHKAESLLAPSLRGLQVTRVDIGFI